MLTIGIFPDKLSIFCLPGWRVLVSCHWPNQIIITSDKWLCCSSRREWNASRRHTESWSILDIQNFDVIIWWSTKHKMINKVYLRQCYVEMGQWLQSFCTHHYIMKYFFVINLCNSCQSFKSVWDHLQWWAIDSLFRSYYSLEGKKSFNHLICLLLQQ